MQYTASTINRTALPRSKRMRALGAASVTPTVVNGESGDKYWNGEIDTETEETEVSTTYPVKISKRLRMVDESGALHGDISIDANGRFVFDKGIISKEDIIAYGVGGSDIKSVTDVIEEYLAEHGVGGYEPPVGGIPKSDLSSSVQASLEKADTALQEHQSLQGYATERWVEGKGYLTAHQDISGKSNTTHTHSVKINGVTKTIAASGGAAVDLGTYLTAHQDISGKADKSSTVSTIAYDSTNKKITKTIDGTTSDVVSVATLKSAMDAVTSTDLGNAISGEVQARINAINALDVASAGGSGKYIQAISQTDGKISATAATLDKSAVGLGNVDNTSDANKNVEGANHILSLGNQTMITGITKPTKTGISLVQVYNNGYTVSYGNVINVRGAGSGQILCEWTGGGGDTGHLYYRSLRDTTDNWTSWKKVAFIGDNTASATKLQTARTLWGNSFDGSANIDGTITMGEGTGGRTVKLTNSGIKFIATSQNGWAMNLVARNHADSSDLATLIGGYGTADTYYYTYLGGTYNNPSMVIKSGQIGIGTTAPSQKLEVNGNAAVSGAIYLANNANYYSGYIGTSSEEMDILAPTDQSLNARPLYLGKRGGTHYMALLNNGNVGIGTDSPSTKLHVSGVSRTKYVDFYSKDRETTRAGWVGRGSENNNGLTLYSDNDFINIDSNTEINLKAVHKQAVKIVHNATALQSYAVIGEASTNCKVANLNFSVNGYGSLARLQFLENGNFYMGRNYETTIGNDNAAVRIAQSGALVLSSTAALSGTRDNAIYIRPLGSNSFTDQVKFESSGVTISASSANGLVIKRTAATSGAFVNYFNNNQSSNAWRVGMNSLNSFVWVYSTNGLSTDTGKLTLDTSGNLVAVGDVTAYSDARLKSEIKDLEYRGPLEPKTYIKDGKKSIGFIAQEVRELYPELVLGEEKEDEYLSLNYGAITAVLAAENKELRSRIDKLETLINKLIEK